MPRIPVMGDDLPASLRDLLGPDIEVLPWDDRPGSDALSRAVGLITYAHPRVDGALLDRAPGLRVVSNHGVGVDHIDLAACQARAIPVGNTPGCLDGATADMTWALLLATARNVVAGHVLAHSPQFTQYDPSALIGQDVSGRVLGIVGLGRIGQQVARRAAGFDMRVLYHNRRRDLAAEQSLHVEFASLEELLSQSDFVTLNCPLTPETVGLISGREFARMKPSAVLVNMARGPVVDHEALFTALTTGQIAAAGLDVTEPEPLPRDHKLLTLPNLVITPHLGSAAARTRQRMQEMTVDNLRAGLEARPLPWEVSLRGGPST